MSLKPTSFALVRKLVHERAAIVLEDGKEYLVEGRLTPLAEAHGFDSVDELCLKLRADTALASEVVEAMTTNETSFFRDQHPFDALRSEILPQLLQRRAGNRTLRIWCAACSTGQEPYSLAMTLHEHFPQHAGWDLRIDATDVSRAVLARAKLGRYSQVEVKRGLSAALLSKYFVQGGISWEIRPEIKRLVRFSELNLIGPWAALETYDVVFLRNVLIYFDAATKLSLLARVRQQIAQDGYLVLGGSESPPQSFTAFARLPIARAGIYRLAKGRASVSHVR